MRDRADHRRVRTGRALIVGRKPKPGPKSADAPKVSADPSIAAAMRLVNGKRPKNDPLPPDAESQLVAEILAARAWHDKERERTKLLRPETQDALDKLSKLSGELDDLLAPGSPLSLLASAHPDDRNSALFYHANLSHPDKESRAQHKRAARLSRKVETDAPRALREFRAKLERRLRLLEEAATSPRGAGDVVSKAFGSPTVLALWGLIETWESFTRTIYAANTAPAVTPVAQLDSEHEMHPEGARVLPMSKAFKAFAGTVLGVTGELRGSIEPARKRACSDAVCWPRRQWLRARI